MSNNDCCLTVARSFQSSFDLTRSLSHISEVRTSVAHLRTHLPHTHHPATSQFYISSVCFLSFLISHFQSDESEFSQFNPTDSSTLKRSAVDDVTDALTEITASFCTDQSALDVIVQAINSAFNSEALQHSVRDSLCTLFVICVFVAVGNDPCM